MRAYYLHARAVKRVSLRAIGHAVRLTERRSGQSPPTWRPVEEGFVVANRQLEIPHAQILRERPVRMLSAFQVAQQHTVELSSRAQGLIRQNLDLIDEGLRCDPEAAAIFRGILCAENRVYGTLAMMNELGVLGAYIPEFGDVVGLWQQDFYHTYTVDAHSLFLIEQLRRLKKGLLGEKFRPVADLVREVRSWDVLFLGCLLHDIGKGKGGGHSERGAQMIPEIGQRLGLSSAETEEVAFLVRHHLHMSAQAERRDVNAPPLIINLAKLVGNRRRLRNLYLLTVADIRSVSSEAWNSWKGGLLAALYRNTTDWLETEIPDEKGPRYLLERAIELADEAETRVLELLADDGVSTERAAAFLHSLPKRYMLTHSPDEIAVHLRAALAYLETGARVGTHVYRPEGPDADFWELVVFAADRPGLFATVTGLLAAAGRNILGADVYTARDGLAMEIYKLSSIRGGVTEEEAERGKFEQRLLDVIEGRQSVEALIVARPPTGPRAVRVRPPLVRISNDDSDFYSIVDVTAQDRRGLLYDIARSLSDLGLNLVTSRASTRASLVRDAFYVTDHGHKIVDPERQEVIRQAVLAAVESSPE
jgi:[protein-PII] uridylyltransferase